MEYNDGTKYEGEWNNDKQHGKGIFTASPSSNNHNLILIKYEGDFINDKKKEKELLFIQMVINMMENGKIINNMEEVLLIIHLVENMKGIGQKENLMD